MNFMFLLYLDRYLSYIEFNILLRPRFKFVIGAYYFLFLPVADSYCSN